MFSIIFDDWFMFFITPHTTPPPPTVATPLIATTPDALPTQSDAQLEDFLELDNIEFLESNNIEGVASAEGGGASQSSAFFNIVDESARRLGSIRKTSELLELSVADLISSNTYSLRELLDDGYTREELRAAGVPEEALLGVDQ